MDDKLELKDGTIWINQDIKKVLQELYDHYRAIQNSNEYLRSELERVKADKFKDEELSKMKKDYNRMKDEYYRGFPISEVESQKISNWMDEQMKKNPSSGGAIGGRFRYEFIPTGIGTIGIVEDIFTKDKLTFQDL